MRCAYADDFGPGGDIRELRFVAPRLLAHRVRQQHNDPQDIKITDVVAVGNDAILSWNGGKDQGVMGLVRVGSRWWDALDIGEGCWQWQASYPLFPDEDDPLGGLPNSGRLLRIGLSSSLVAAAVVHNRDVRRGEHAPPSCTIDYYQIQSFVTRAGGTATVLRPETSGYSIVIEYTANNAAGKTPLSIYARPPTDAEFLPYPTPGQYVPNAVAYFDLTINGKAPVTFAPGTTIDIWFPFVLDDRLNYDLTIGYADKPIGPIYARAFDNVLHYVLPAFTVTPGRTLMAEIDGNRH